MDFYSTLMQAFRNKAARGFPNRADTRSRGGALFPIHKRKFDVRFSPDQTIFTIGSCFARNIEEALVERNVFLPTRTFRDRPSERKFRSNGLLNEYNPGTISQRIIFALQGREFPGETIVPCGDLFADLLLPFERDVTLEMAQVRRAEIKAVYDHLANADLVIITLGFIEAWYDTETGLYLNRAPPIAFGRKSPARFVFKQLDVFDSMVLLEEAIAALSKAGIKTIVTLSPVPIATTMTTKDCIVANEFSKAVLRVCSERLCRHDLVDYFPSYEIVRSRGLSGYIDDQVHVKDALVREIVQYMISLYE
jgi:hypothetical protein